MLGTNKPVNQHHLPIRNDCQTSCGTDYYVWLKRTEVTGRLMLVKKMKGCTLRLSSAASSFLLISSRERSFFFGEARGNSILASGTGLERMTSNAWPEALLSSSLTRISENDRFRRLSRTSNVINLILHKHRMLSHHLKQPLAQKTTGSVCLKEKKTTLKTREPKKHEALARIKLRQKGSKHKRKAGPDLTLRNRTCSTALICVRAHLCWHVRNLARRFRGSRVTKQKTGAYSSNTKRRVHAWNQTHEVHVQNIWFG